MSLKNYSPEEVQDFSMIELANLILIEENKATDFRQVYDRIAELKGFSQEQKHENIAQFYTDLNIDGRFMTTGLNLWGLKQWYPVEQFEEEITSAPKKKKKKKAATKKKAKVKEVEEDLDEEELDLDSTELDVDLDDYDEDLDESDDTDDDYDDFDDPEELDDEEYDEDDEDDEDLSDDEDDEKDKD